MASFHVTPPENFNFKNPEEFEKWITRFERFKIASGLNEKSEEQQVNTLVYCMERQADDIFHSFNLQTLNRESIKQSQTSLKTTLL
ncbi:MAG: hypothetical protein JAZ03_12315 [Candidatus Thiodiazotropha taylori]|nr:hypothetical protein [Candidatus Thiodiazotropha taylori]MCW4334711.1 hypothetical protein [Candidatus Thiodiazotropha endolucinida]